MGAGSIPAPTCPTYQAPGPRRRRPSGHEATEWHLEGEDALARLWRCPETYQPSPARRGLASGTRTPPAPDHGLDLDLNPTSLQEIR